MSSRFEHFVTRVARRSDFLPIRNQLLITMKRDAEAKYKNYPRTVERMKKTWEEESYMRNNDISGLIANNIEEFLVSYLIMLFPFRKRGITLEKVSTPSRLDVVIGISYDFSEKELKIIQNTLETREFPKDPTTEKICKFLFLYCINSFAYPIEEVFQRPFAFMPQSVKAEWIDERLKVIVSVQGREQ
ncbi:MAG: hypothetical protein JW776_09745 [Candidatus Lokiarchaeota archaeon]|nr:hypothetical protein [Candidatus Lokiarchaeota archaeon]